METAVPSQRIRSIDTVRGAIMVIMALDHVRDYFHITALSANPLDPVSTTPALFFTRWITHFCAPTFLMLSGISAFLSGQKKDVRETSSFLLKRGFFLILVEVTFMTFAFTFDVTFKMTILAVLWSLGCSMLILGTLVRFMSPKAILVTGLVLVFGHNLLDYVKLIPNSPLEIISSILLTGSGRFYPRGDGGTLAFLYVILPWAGIMLVGYGLGCLYVKNYPAAKRKKVLVIAGLAVILLFVVLRLINVYGDPAAWTVQKTGVRTFFSFLNVSKYPPSLLFTLVTQGPVLLLLACTETSANWLARIFTVYGRVPFFYFMTHFYLAHLLCMLAVFASGYTWEQATAPELFFKFRPADFGYGLGWVYLVWLAVVAALYWPCRWFGAYRSQRKSWWLRYL